MKTLLLFFISLSNSLENNDFFVTFSGDFEKDGDKSQSVIFLNVYKTPPNFKPGDEKE